MKTIYRLYILSSFIGSFRVFFMTLLFEDIMLDSLHLRPTKGFYMFYMAGSSEGADKLHSDVSLWIHLENGYS